MRKIICGMIIVLLILGVFPLAFNVQLVKAASGTIYIKADGSVDPSSAPILNVGNEYYTFTANIYDSLVVERDNIVVDGAEHVLQGAGTGINLTGRSNVTIKSMTIREFDYGIWLSYSSYSNSISANNITNNGCGILLDYSSNNGVSANYIANNTYYGIELYYSSYNSISANNITNNDGYGIYLYHSSNNGVSANYIANNAYYGIELSSSSYSNSITANTITNNSGHGIYLYSSSYNDISANTVTNHQKDGILLDYSSYNSISANNIKNNNWLGIYVHYSSYSNSITANNITNNYYGIELYFSSYSNSITANNITNNNYFGIHLISSSYNIMSANNITSNKYYGIFLEHSSCNGISANYIANNTDGVALSSSSSNSISANTVTNNTYGIDIYFYSNSNSISANTITKNYRGIRLYYYSNSNSISANSIANNAYGIRLDYSESNLIYHNNFVGNTAQATVSPLGSVNTWNDGYPSGGNYWSDYTGVDLYKGPNQNVPGSDGIGDTPYMIDANNKDNYPLVNPWTIITNVASLVVRGPDNKVWYRTYSGGVWGSWYPIAAATGDSLGAAMLGGNLHIIARDLSGTTIWHGYVNVATNVFSGWTLISGKPVSAPTLASNGVVLSLVVRGGDNKVWYRTYSGGVWGSWHSIAAATGDSLGAAMLGNNLHIIARNLAGTAIYHGYVDVTINVFSGWTLISGVPVSAPTLTSNGAVLSLVVRGGDNKVWYRTYSGTWGSWHSIAAATGDSPAATMLGNNLHIVARDISGTTIWHSYVDVTTNAFSGWTLISGHPVSKPTLAS